MWKIVKTKEKKKVNCIFNVFEKQKHKLQIYKYCKYFVILRQKYQKVKKNIIIKIKKIYILDKKKTKKIYMYMYIYIEIIY